MAFLSIPLAPITPAEQRVLIHVGQGLSNKAIAATLVLSPRTVESHVSSLLAKTGCRSRTELLLWWLDTGDGSGDMLPSAGQADPRHPPA
jgi:DNA-binding NarL/FixJ family response regulator